MNALKIENQWPMSNIQIVSMTAEEYHADRTAVSKSWLDKINQSPAHLRYYLDNPQESKSKALAFGSLSHSFILEDDISHYVVTPEFSCASNAGKQAYYDYLKVLNPSGFEELIYNTKAKPLRCDLDNFLTQTLKAQGKIACTEADLKIAHAVRDAIRSHEAASLLLCKGQAEVTSFYEDQDTGVLCKARADWYRSDLGWIVDLKSTANASPKEFERSIANYRYHVQPAHYMPAFEAEKFFFIAFEKTPPYAVAVYDAEQLLEHGRLHRNHNLIHYRRCVDANHWPAYSNEIQILSLKEWAKFI